MVWFTEKDSLYKLNDTNKHEESLQIRYYKGVCSHESNISADLAFKLFL
jgi:hypothetical protein